VCVGGYVFGFPIVVVLVSSSTIHDPSTSHPELLEK